MEDILPKRDNNGILLTIAIPTYNRAKYLDQCLDHICRQLGEYKSIIELIVSNNNSEDETETVVSKYRSNGININYVKNFKNIGADRNFAQCFALATGKYVLILGDDDILLDGAIDRILAVLKAGEYGLIYLNSYGFNADYQLEMPRKRKTGTVIYTNQARFIERINYWITFASGNIVNKSLLDSDFNPAEFVGTNLVQLNWVLSAIFGAKENVVIEDYVVAFKSANTGGYQLCQVFGVNINRIFEAFVEKGINRKNFDVINRKLVQTFFPNLIVMQRKQSGGFNFEAEDYFKTLRQVFGRYLSFWFVTVPSIKLPVKLASLWIKLCNRILSLVKG